MRTERRRGWWPAGLAAAIALTALAGPARAPLLARELVLPPPSSPVAPPPRKAAPAKPSAQPPPAAFPPRAGLVAFYPIDGGPRDTVGTHHGTAANVAYTSDRHGSQKGALLLDGRRGSVRVRDHDELDTDEAFTLCAWIKPAAFRDHRGAAPCILSKWAYSRTGCGDYQLRLTTSGRVDFRVSQGKGAVAEVPSAKPVEKNRWTHVAATFDGGAMRLYVNGRGDATKTSSKVKRAIPQEYAGDDLYIGSAHDGTGRFHGAIDEVCIYRRALSAEEVGQVYRSNRALLSIPSLSRVAHADRIKMANGDVLLGTILRDRYVLTTSLLGRLTIPAGRVVGLVPVAKPQASPPAATAPARPADRRVRLLLTDGQVLVGEPAETVLRLKMTSGTILRVPVGNILQCAYRVTPARPASAAPAATTVTLWTGERLAVTGALPKLQLLLPGNPQRTIDLPVKGILRVESAAAACQVHFANGSRLTGTLLPETLTLKTQFAPALRLARERIRQIKGTTKAVRPGGSASLTMRSRDQLRGRIGDQRLTVQTKYGEASIHPGAAKTITFDSGGGKAAVVKMWGGTVLRGRIVEPAVTFEIVPGGPTVKVPTAEIVSIAHSDAVPPPEVVRKAEALIRQLASDKFKQREAAVEALVGMGPGIVSVLRRHLGSPKPEVRQRIRDVMERLGARPAAPPKAPPRRRPTVQGAVERA